MGVPDERFFTAVREALPPDRLSRDPDELVRYGGDWTRVHERRASAVAFPRSTDEVSRLLRLCDEHEVWVVPSGGRTGLAAGAVATRGELVLSLEKMNAIGEVDALSQTVHVEAGAVTQAVDTACRTRGLTWPIDLASKGSSQIGGNIATNAGGVRVIRYGPTRHWVLGLVAVTMGGQVLRLNGALEKNNTGLDLRQLLIGSEGTLAVVTEAVLKLARVPPRAEVMLFAAPDLNGALRLAERTRGGAFDLMALELFTDACLREVERRGLGRSPFRERSAVYLLVEGVSRDTDTLDEWLEAVLAEDMVQEGVRASSPAQARALWALRENITESLSHRAIVHKNDVAVPVYALGAFIEELEALFSARFPELEVFFFGHVGDGNLHVNLPLPARMERAAFRRRIAEVDEAMGSLLEAHEGSISAEHGIGLIKKPLLRYTRGPEELALFRAIKRAFDPKGLLNPGKVIDV